MSSGRINGSVGARGDSYSYYIDWQAFPDAATNSSLVKAWVHITCSKHSAYQNNCGQNLYINGVHFSNSVNVNLSAGVNVELIYGETRIYHDNDGRKCINISANGTLPYGSGWGPSSGNAGADVWLDTIPRGTTVWNSERGKTLDTVSVNWSTADARNWTQYSLNGGTWTNAGDIVAGDNKSGYYTVSGLLPNTTYSIRTRCMRMDSGIWSEAGTIYIQTKDYAKITNNLNSNFGETVNINFSNLANGTSKLIVKIGNTEVCIRENLTTNYALSFTKQELSKMIKLLKNETTEVTYTVITNNKYTATVKAIVTLKANIYKKKNGKWIKAKIYKKNENWKLTKLLFKVNGVWRNTK